MKAFTYHRVNGDIASLQDRKDAASPAADEEDLPNETIAADHQLSRKDFRPIFIGLVLGFALGLLTFSIITSTITIPSTEPAADTCTQKMSAWSPALAIYDGDSDLATRRFNGTLRKSNRFRGPPSQAIDDAWDEITYPAGGLVRLSQAQLDRINASEFAAAYTQDMGGGYMAGLATFHQLHCVNMLRQATYMDYYLPRHEEWRRDRETLRYHLDHCIDMLRQKLMCDPDLSMVTYVWAKGWKQPFPDFNAVHKCRPFEKVLDWAHENHVHGRNVADIERAPGALERDTRP